MERHAEQAVAFGEVPATADRPPRAHGDAAPAQEAPGPDDRIASLTFDAALAQLGDVVARLETGGLPLETSIALYERGVALHAHCARLLDDAELRVQRLVEDAGGVRAIDLTPDDPDDAGSAGA